MPASKKIEKQTNNPEILGVIAGSGCLPERLVQACDQKGIETFIIGFDGRTNHDLVMGRNYLWTRIGCAGQIISTLKAHQIKDLVLIGAMDRPTLAELRPDMRTAKFFAKIGLKAIGDNDLLGLLRAELEGEGFTIHGIQQFVTDLLAGKGPVGKYKIKKNYEDDVKRGLRVAQELGALDVGQSVVIQEGIVLAVEGAEGTDGLIARSKELRKNGRAPILVKCSKPGQDQDLDLPTIGPETIQAAVNAGLGGIVIHTAHTLLIDPSRVAQIADKHKLFVVGVDPAQYLQKA